jgi:hypothetical protein
MSETTQEAVELDTVDELSVLKSRARMMGIEFSNNIGLEKLRQKIAAKMEGEPDPTEATTEAPQAAQVNPLDSDAPPPGKVLTLREYLVQTELKLIRLRITNMDPKKKDLPGEIFTVANEYLGTVRKYIPYGEASEHGYHVPYCIYRELESRRFLNIRTANNRNGQQITVESNWAKEFALEILDPLTPKELHQLATAQAAAGVFAA